LELSPTLNCLREKEDAKLSLLLHSQRCTTSDRLDIGKRKGGSPSPLHTRYPKKLRFTRKSKTASRSASSSSSSPAPPIPRRVTRSQLARAASAKNGRPTNDAASWSRDEETLEISPQHQACSGGRLVGVAKLTPASSQHWLSSVALSPISPPLPLPESSGADDSPFSGFTMESTPISPTANNIENAVSPISSSLSLTNPSPFGPAPVRAPLNLFDRFVTSDGTQGDVKGESHVNQDKVKTDKLVSLGSSGRALVLSAQGLEEVAMNADVANDFFQSHAHQVSRDKLRALQILPAEKIFVKGSTEYRLMTSTMSEMGRCIAKFCSHRGLTNPQELSAKMMMNSLFDAWIKTELPHLGNTKVRPCEGRTAMGFLRHLTRVSFYCCYKKAVKKGGKTDSIAITYPGFDK